MGWTTREKVQETSRHKTNAVSMRAGERRWAVVPPNEGYWSVGWPAHGNLGGLFKGVPRDAFIVLDVTCVQLQEERWWASRGPMRSPEDVPYDRGRRQPQGRGA